MPGSRSDKSFPLRDAEGTTLGCNAAFVEVHRGLKAITFYPENHPLREEILNRAYQAMLSLMKAEGVSLFVQRDGFSFVDREVPVEKNPMTAALAKELFTREIQELTVRPELTLREFTEFLTLLAAEPNRVIAGGGMRQMLKDHGIHSVIANEIDITAVFSKKMVKEPTDEAVAETSGTQDERDRGTECVEGSLSDDLGELNIEELIAMMEIEAGDDRYCQLANYLQARGQTLKKEGDFDRLFPVLPILLKQSADKQRSPIQSGCALAVFRQLAREEMAEHLLDHLADRDFTRQELVYLIFGRLGEEAVGAVIRRMVTGNDLYARKAMATALVKIGEPAVPQLLQVLNDGRWQIVRTAVTILGEIGSRNAVPGLAQSAFNPDNRVRMEAIRSLALIGGREATLLILDLLRDRNQAIRKQAIIWLGNTKNDKALEPLLGIIMKRDLLGRAEDIKREALMAIGRIGDRRALESLYKLAGKRHWLDRDRRERLQLLAVETIGQLGGEYSRDYLERLSARGGRIGRACTSQLETMTQRD